MKRFVKRGILGIVILAIVGLSGLWLLHKGNKHPVSFRTVPVTRGDLVATISATGTVEPEEVIDVGAQVAGRIVTFGKDKSGKLIDYGSEIENGTILAEIDDSLYSADVGTAKAQLEQARASVIRAEADLGQMQAKLVQTERDWNRAKKLGPSDALSQSDYDASLSNYETAKANLAVGKATISQSKSAVDQSLANLRRAQQNLDYCTIISPVNGVIVDRRVNIGQTVVSSLNAPSLFLIAKDLKRMQVWVSVNEADIGSISPGQPATFTVDAYPGQVFQGQVGKVRLNATMTQNVVTYTVEVNTDNSSGKLLPYLTANLKFTVKERRNVLLVPNAALRWTPQPSQMPTDSGGGSGPGGKGGDKAPKSQEPATPAKQESTTGVVWVRDGAALRSIPVQVGLTDGSTTEVEGEELKEGIQVVIGEQQEGSAEAVSSTNPFLPQIFGRGGHR